MYNNDVNTVCIIFMDREIENPFAAILRTMRGNTPQGVFAEKLGLKQAKYSHYENKRREPSLDELCRIARSLNTTPDVLLGFSPIPQPTVIAGDNSAIAIGHHITQTVNTLPKKKSKNENERHY